MRLRSAPARPRPALSAVDRIRNRNRRRASLDQALVMADLPAPQGRLNRLREHTLGVPPPLHETQRGSSPATPDFTPPNTQLNEGENTVNVL
jgi:hypothetical protein